MSADTKYLAFNTERGGDREIYIKDLDTGKETRITHRAGRDGYPKFSPDGKQLAYHSEIEGANTVIRVLDLESNEMVEFSCANIQTSNP
jgi:TolB protein